jgi:hypothetical protein
MEYKMKGQIPCDYTTAIDLWEKAGLHVTVKEYKYHDGRFVGSRKGNWIPLHYPDFELTIESSAPKQVLIDTLKECQDLYLMYQTIEYSDQFTGKRMHQ